MTAGIFSVTTLLVFAVSAYASHFRGGLIQWKSVDSTTVSKIFLEINSYMYIIVIQLNE